MSGSATGGRASSAATSPPRHVRVDGAAVLAPPED